jgi:TonB-linked SusC/RagA family outer membrane protein
LTQLIKQAYESNQKTAIGFYNLQRSNHCCTHPSVNLYLIIILIQIINLKLMKIKFHVKKLSILLLMLSIGLGSFAQNKTISGTVKGDDTMLLPGVTVVVKGTTQGTVTNVSGEFNLPNVSEDAILQFSFIGMKAQEIPVAGVSTLNVVMESETLGLDEVVVVGYGTMKKSDLTGSVVSINEEALLSRPSVNLEQMLQGNMAGLSLSVDGNSAEGSNNTLNIRGKSSISAGNSPLIILDGVPFEGSLSEINPNDVGSIEILKDASSAAIYGARASSGVILISTKKGERGKMITSYNGYFGFDPMVNVPKLLDGSTFYELKTARDLATTTTEDEGYAEGRSTDWLSLITQTGKRQEHNISFRGATEKTNYYVSAGYTDVQGIAIGDEYTRFLFRVNLEQKLNSWISFGTNSQFGYYDRSGVEANFGNAYIMNPLGEAYNEDGSMKLYTWEDAVYNVNPLNTTLYENSDITRRFFTNNYIQMDFPFLKGLTYKLNTGYDYSSRLAQTYRGLDTDAGLTTSGSLDVNSFYEENWLIENIVSYSADFGKHKIFITGLYSAQNEWNDTEKLHAEGFPNDVMTYYQADNATLIEPSSNYSENAHLSQMVRAHYSYDSKYMLTATVRRDGYSAFGADQKFGIFPSVALGWNIAEESFMQNADALDQLKLRVSYGSVGNEAISSYSTLSTLSSINYVDADGNTLFGFYPEDIGDASLSWETSKSINVGVDFGFFNSRLRGLVDVYYGRTTDLLLDKSISAVNGTDNITQNIGETKKRGIEFQISSINISKPNFTWSTNFNIAHNRSEIVNVGLTDENGNYTDDVGSKWFIGEPIDVDYDYAFDGIWQEDTEDTPQGSVTAGDIKVKDADGDGEITTDDRIIQGQADPDFIAGMTNNLKYKNWSFVVFVNASYGINKVNDFLSTNDQDLRYNRYPVEYWTAENMSNSYSRNDRTQNTNSYGVDFYRDANFIRIQEVTLSYDFPKTVLDRIGFSNLNMYVNVKNPLTITNWKGLDPEFDDQLDKPQNMTYLFGMKFSF